MIWFFVKFLTAFFISFLLLSISVNKRTIFSHLYNLLGPLGNDITKSVTKSIDRSSKVGKSLFDNSPTIPKNLNADEDILEQEKVQLDKIISDHQ